MWATIGFTEKLSVDCHHKNHIPYSGKFSLVQIFAEKRPDSSEEIFAVFIFADAGRSGHTPTSGWPRLICETALNDEAKKQACATTA